MCIYWAVYKLPKVCWMYNFFVSGTYIPSLMNINSCLHSVIAKTHLNSLPSLFSFQTIKSMRPLSSSCGTSSVGEFQQLSLHWPRKLKRKFCQQAVISCGSLQSIAQCMKHWVSCIHIIYGPKASENQSFEHPTKLENVLADWHSPDIRIA
jgi:hypothetical protein